MDLFLLILCLLLIVACALARWQAAVQIEQARLRVAELTAERKGLQGQRRQLEVNLEYVQALEQEIATDGRALTEELNEVRKRIEKLERIEKRIKDRRDEGPF